MLPKRLAFISAHRVRLVFAELVPVTLPTPSQNAQKQANLQNYRFYLPELLDCQVSKIRPNVTHIKQNKGFIFNQLLS